jgi:16S rRNA (guanine966-N2)-methyltransferase
MRVIAGKYRSRPLRSPRGTDIRPTSDRLRETLFNVLCAGNPDALTGSTWIDLYAGTGAVGMEALSRGAALVYFVESSKAAAELIVQNLKSLGITNGFKVMNIEAARGLRQLQGQAVIADFVFLDPPYSLENEYAKTLATLAESKLVGERTLVIAEHQKKSDSGEGFEHLRRFRKLVQGDAALSFYKR